MPSCVCENNLCAFGCRNLRGATPKAHEDEAFWDFSRQCRSSIIVGLSRPFFSSSLSELRQLIEQGVPVIVLIWTEPLAYWNDACMHAVIVTGFDAEVILVQDAAFSDYPIRIPVDQFEIGWAYSRQLSIQIERHSADN